MNNLKVVIVEDVASIRETLRGLLDLFCENVSVVGEAHDIASAKAVIISTQPDLVFLDIDLNGEHGFDLLTHFNPVSFHIIFSTGYKDYAFEAFQVDAIDYLMKPVDPELLIKAINKVRKIGIKKEEKIAIVTSEGRHLIEIEKIIRVEGAGSYSTFFIENEDPIMVSKNLKHYESLLKYNIFLRPHQSHLVNLNFIKMLSTKGTIHLKNGEDLPVSRAHRKKTKDLIDDWFRS